MLESTWERRESMRVTQDCTWVKLGSSSEKRGNTSGKKASRWGRQESTGEN